jgi:hypothetical protein
LVAESHAVPLFGVLTYDLVQSGLGFDVYPEDCNGTYKVRVFLYGNGRSRYKDVNVTVSEATDCSPATPLLALGTLSGSTMLSPESPITLTASVTVENVSVSSVTAVVLDSQENEALYPFVSGWSTYNDTKFYKLTRVDFESLSTRSEVEALWVEGQAVSTSVEVAVGDVLIARSNEAMRLLKQAQSAMKAAEYQKAVDVAEEAEEKIAAAR